MNQCSETSSKGYYCVREPGHIGAHVALGNNNEAYAIWDNEDEWPREEESDYHCDAQTLDGYYCTRKSGHRGSHIAMGRTNEVCVVWSCHEWRPQEKQ